jgi:hypothetical protein
MNKRILPLIALIVLAGAAGCTLSLLGKPSSLPSIVIPSPTPPSASATVALPSLSVVTPIISLPSLTPGATVAATSSAPIPTVGGIQAGNPSGPYAVVRVLPGDVLTIRTGPGAEYASAGTFDASAATIMRTGPSSMVGEDLWVQVQNPSGGSGWVNAAFLSEAVSPAVFCADSRVPTLLVNFGNALKTANGTALASTVSPAHGMTVYLWRYGTPHTFKPADARWVFDSTYEHNWGMQPASGLDTIGSFQEAVLPNLRDVFNSSYTSTCDALGNAPQYGEHPWPQEYAGINYYTAFKPGTPGVDLDWRTWLVGVEYIQGQPYIFAVIHFAWEP